MNREETSDQFNRFAEFVKRAVDDLLKSLEAREDALQIAHEFLREDLVLRIDSAGATFGPPGGPEVPEYPPDQ